MEKLIEKMQQNAHEDENPTISRLTMILRETSSVKERRLSAMPSHALVAAIASANFTPPADCKDNMVATRRMSYEQQIASVTAPSWNKIPRSVSSTATSPITSLSYAGATGPSNHQEMAQQVME
jgi:hypothetical protein